MGFLDEEREQAIFSTIKRPAWHAGGQGFDPPQVHQFFQYFFSWACPEIGDVSNLYPLSNRLQQSQSDEAKAGWGVSCSMPPLPPFESPGGWEIG